MEKVILTNEEYLPVHVLAQICRDDKPTKAYSGQLDLFITGVSECGSDPLRQHEDDIASVVGYFTD